MQVQTTGLKPVSTKQQLSTCMQTSEVNVENKLHDEQVQTEQLIQMNEVNANNSTIK